jgi:hypothetical protein
MSAVTAVNTQQLQPQLRTSRVKSSCHVIGIINFNTDQIHFPPVVGAELGSCMHIIRKTYSKYVMGF